MIYNLFLLLPCAICLIGAAWLICKRKSNTFSQHILVVGFLISAIFFLSTANYVANSFDSTTFMWWDIIDSFIAMSVIPTMYLYIRSTMQEGRFTWKEYIGFAPALVVGGATVVLYMMMDETARDGYIESVLIEGGGNDIYGDSIYKLHQFIGFEVYNFIALLQIVLAGVFTVIGVRKYHQRLREFYSDADHKSIDTDNKLLYWCLFTIPLSLALIVPDIKFWSSHPVWLSLLFGAWAVVYFALFYYGSQNRPTVDNFVQDLQQADLEERTYFDLTAELSEKPNVEGKEMADKQMSSEVYQRLLTQFAKLIDQDKIYLKSDLRLDEVARLMFTNRAYVSKVIKEEYHCSFSDYINGKRIDFSMDFMRLEPNETQDKIAEKSGFINAQSYSRTFKKMVGMPPKEWLNRKVGGV